MSCVFVPREVKNHEYRVGLVPAGVREIAARGHAVLVERGAGEGSGFSDADYVRSGAALVETARQGFEAASHVVKVKEPQESELELLHPDLTLFAYLHLAASRELTEGLLKTGAMALAYETLLDGAGRLPLLTPMSEIAGRVSVQEGARMLLRPQGGRGVLLGGAPGVEPGHVTIVGGGVVGTEAARMAAGLGARVHLLERDLERIRILEARLPRNVTVLFSDADALHQELARADLVIGAVLLRGARAPRLIRREDLRLMKPGAVIVDVAVDQGGIAETIHPTTHDEPSYVVDGVVHYGVANIPGAVPATSTRALCNATLPYVLRLLERTDLEQLLADQELASSLSICRGQLVDEAVGESLGLPTGRLA